MPLIPGTAWSIDPTTKQVVVTTDETVTGSKLSALTAVTNRLGDRVRIETTAGEFTTRLAGGDAIYGGGSRCSAGFNVTDGTYSYLLTAGHCGNIVDSWYADGGQSTLVGYVEGSSFPGNDYALVGYYNDIPRPGEVNLYNGSTQDITAAGNAYVGEQVRRSGSTTGVFGGQVQGLNATVNYQEGSVLPHPDQRLRRGRRQRRRVVRQQRGAGSDLRRQRQLQQRWHDVLPARHRGVERVRDEHLLTGSRRPALRRR